MLGDWRPRALVMVSSSRWVPFSFSPDRRIPVAPAHRPAGASVYRPFKLLIGQILIVFAIVVAGLWAVTSGMRPPQAWSPSIFDGRETRRRII